MKTRPLLFIFSLLLLPWAGHGQTQRDSIAARPKITPSIYLDYGKILTIPFDFETKYEGGIEVLFFDKIPLIAEIGQATLAPKGAYSNGTYQSSGFYYRIGLGYLSQFKPKNKIGLTVRYGISHFEERGEVLIQSPSGAQEDLTQVIERSNLDARWYEVVLYSDRQLSKLFSIGLNLRLRILGTYTQQEVPDVYAIPGYGRTFDRTIPAANLFLKVHF